MLMEVDKQVYNWVEAVSIKRWFLTAPAFCVYRGLLSEPPPPHTHTHQMLLSLSIRTKTLIWKFVARTPSVNLLHSFFFYFAALALDLWMPGKVWFTILGKLLKNFLRGVNSLLLCLRTRMCEMRKAASILENNIPRTRIWRYHQV